MKWLTDFRPTQMATLVSISSRRYARLGGSPHSVRSLPISASVSGLTERLMVAETLPESIACLRARILSTTGFASRRRQLGPPVSSLAESAGLGGLSLSHGTRKWPPLRVPGRAWPSVTRPRMPRTCATILSTSPGTRR